MTEVFYGTDTSTSDGTLTSTTYNLTYDANGNITKIANALGVAQYQYAYDSMGQLIREDNRALGKTFVYEYDNAGNILAKKEYAYTEGSLDGVTPTSTTDYTYGNASWGDQLTSVGGATLTYDAIGNLTGITTAGGTVQLTWQGRELQSYGTTTYTYNADGIRTSKTVNGVKHTYVLYGSQILSETWGDHVLLYVYDELNTPVGLKYRNSTYADGVYDCFFFEKNFLGDIISIYNESGTKIGGYTYDAWGNCTVTNGYSTTTGTLAYNILHSYNPFRYRGYYYDVDTGLYYLQSRYYNAQWGRFINADGYVSTGQGILGNNMYAYCGNNPVMQEDAQGTFFKKLKEKAQNAWNVIKSVASNIFGAESTTTSTTYHSENTIVSPPVSVTTGVERSETVSSKGDSSKLFSVYADKNVQHPVKSSSVGLKINIGDFSLNVSLGLDNIGISGSIKNGNTTESVGLKVNLAEFNVGAESSIARQKDNKTTTNYANVSVDGLLVVAVVVSYFGIPVPVPA